MSARFGARQCGVYSKYLALQIKATELGLCNLRPACTARGVELAEVTRQLIGSGQ